MNRLKNILTLLLLGCSASFMWGRELQNIDTDWIVDWAEQAVGQLLEVESVNGNTLTFSLPLNFDFSTELNAQIRPQGFIHGVGLEDFYLEKMVSAGHSIVLKNTAYCWIRNVENNIFDSLRHAMLIQVGANGNVYGYNYSMHPVQGEGETNLNSGWDPPDISIHGHYAYMNLFEGNRVYEIGIGDYWGPAGPGNTLFRNKVIDEDNILPAQLRFENLPVIIDKTEDLASVPIMVYPNPASSYLHIAYPKQIESLRLLNMAGQVVSFMDGQSRNRIRLDLGDVKHGIYLLEIRDRDKGVHISKVVLQ